MIAEKKSMVIKYADPRLDPGLRAVRIKCMIREQPIFVIDFSGKFDSSVFPNPPYHNRCYWIKVNEARKSNSKED